ncbi:methyl-accepting chemotaxis protein [Robbsia sp. KACC 23696]|uniref:methyl-accepting chemotaxis protein n=1 Tax=Robbsia sp. KACC 23696 TaxID=3149231 RepID=UPI00325A6182
MTPQKKGLSLQTRIAVTMAFLALLMLIIGAIGLLSTTRAIKSNRDTYENKLTAATNLGNAEIYLARTRLVLDRVALHPEDPSTPQQLTRASGFFKDSDNWWQKFVDQTHEASESALIETASQKRQAMFAGVSAFINAIQAGDRATADKITMTQLSALYNAMSDSNQAIKTALFANAKRNFETTESQFQQMTVLSIVMIVLGIAAAAFSWFSLRHAIMTPLYQALGHFDAISRGNLSEAIHARSADEMGTLIQGVASMQTSLAGTVRTVRSSSESIATATREIAAGTVDLAARTEEQAASLEETAASMSQLTATVKQNAESARQGTVVAEKASQVASQGNTVVERVVGTMGGIDESSRKIADITGIIEGIAFQTNILALNAAVEAARAGEQGRGFAVVATEVRNLAQRSSVAAKEIKELISVSVEKVAVGSSLVAEAGETMHEVLSSVKQVQDIMNELSAAAEEQRAGIEQVDSAVSQMDSITQQNAALVEQATAAAQALDEQSQRLNAAVAVFQLR